MLLSTRDLAILMNKLIKCSNILLGSRLMIWCYRLHTWGFFFLSHKYKYYHLYLFIGLSMAMLQIWPLNVISGFHKCCRDYNGSPNAFVRTCPTFFFVSQIEKKSIRRLLFDCIHHVHKWKPLIGIIKQF